MLVKLPNGVWINPDEVSSIESGVMSALITMSSGRMYEFQCHSTLTESLSGAIDRRISELVDIVQPPTAKVPQAPLPGGQRQTPPEGEKRPSPPPAPPQKPLAGLGDKLLDCAKQLHDAQSAHHRQMAEEAARLWKKLDQPQQGDPAWGVDCKPILKALGIDAAKGIDILTIEVRATLPMPPFIPCKRHGEMQYRNNEDGKLYDLEFTIKEAGT